MWSLRALHSFFWKYRLRLLGGVIFILISNYFAVLAPQITGYVIDSVHQHMPGHEFKDPKTYQDPLVVWIIHTINQLSRNFSSVVILCGLVLLLMALLRGLFMFFMRQTIVVMSRLIEYDQKNQIFNHYQALDLHFYKTHETGDMMNRMAEDVGRVRSFTGPAVMYLINLSALIGLIVFNMVKKNEELALYVLAPLPILALTIYFVNQSIDRQSETVQRELSGLTSDAQQSYSGIRVIKSYMQEISMLTFFTGKSESYRKASTQLSKTEALYSPAMALIIGVSTLLVIYAGGKASMNGTLPFGDMAAFIMYLTMLTFPVSVIGWVASTIQRAATSQKRINEFLNTESAIKNGHLPVKKIQHSIHFNNVSFIYEHTGIHALKEIDIKIKAGEKIAVVGKTGSGKTTLAHLLLRYYDPSMGCLEVDGKPVHQMELNDYRNTISYVPQEAFLFSDTIYNNIAIANDTSSKESVWIAAKRAFIHDEIIHFNAGYETVIGERGITLSGGQKQRISLARALIKESSLYIFDDCYNAVDAQTEKKITDMLVEFLKDKTAIIITHRITALPNVDRILVMDQGKIVESGTHEELVAHKGIYEHMLAIQLRSEA
jgi:ATP-binding cassette subfamily B protein